MYHPGSVSTNRSPTIYWPPAITRTFHTYLTTANLCGGLGALAAFVCLFGLHEPWNMLLPLAIILGIWTILRPRIALYLLPLAIPWGYLDEIGVITQKLPFSMADFLIGTLSISWLLSFVLRRLVSAHNGKNGQLDFAPEDSPPGYLLIAMLVLLLAMGISIVSASSLSLSFKETTKWIEVLIVLFLGTHYLRTRTHIWTLVVIICLAAISQAFLGYAQNFLQLGPASFIRSNALRVYGTFSQPNPYAGYIDMALTISLALTLLSRKAGVRILAGIATLLLGYAFYLAQSNGGQIALAAAVFFIFVAGFPRLRPISWGGLILLLCLFAAYLAGKLPSSLLNPIVKLLKLVGFVPISFSAPGADDYSVAERLAHWIAGVHMFQANPLTGVGIGNYPAAYPHYYITIFVNPLGHAHNYYINIAAETGILGLLAFLCFLGTFFVAGARAYHTINRCYQAIIAQRTVPKSGTTSKQARASLQLLNTLNTDHALAVGLMAALISVCVHNIVDNLYVHGMTILFALLLVLLLRLSTILTRASGTTLYKGHPGGHSDYR